MGNQQLCREYRTQRSMKLPVGRAFASCGLLQTNIFTTLSMFDSRKIL